MLKKLFDGLTAKSREQRRLDLYRGLIRHEAKIGGQLFGLVAPGGRREFFCLDENTWVWHEEWVDSSSQRQIKTTRYDVRPTGILKAQDGQQYQRVSLDEARRLNQAAQAYKDKVFNELYSFAR